MYVESVWFEYKIDDFFCRHKSAYDVRISDWSSDVCASDLTVAMSSRPRDQVIKAISEGGAAVNKSALMPTWSGVLTHEQIEDMADYLIYVCKCDQAK